MNHEGVCRTAPATPGLLNTKYTKDAEILHLSFIIYGIQIYGLRPPNQEQGRCDLL